MVSNELKQLLNGESSYLRDRAPEPLLLPRIASRIAPEGLGFIALAANTLSSFWMSGGWPAIADATAEAIALRHTELSDKQLQEICDELPRLPLALIELDETAGKRAEAIIGSDAANWLRTELGDPVFFLREAVNRVFDEADPPQTTDELMVFIKDHTEYESPEIQRNLLAYFLPMAPAVHRQWMVPILVEVLGTYPDWSVAAGASRVAGIWIRPPLNRLNRRWNVMSPGPITCVTYWKAVQLSPHSKRLPGHYPMTAVLRAFLLVRLRLPL